MSAFPQGTRIVFPLLVTLDGVSTGNEQKTRRPLADLGNCGDVRDTGGDTFC